MSTHNSKGITDEQIITVLKEEKTLEAMAKRLGCSVRNITKRRAKLVERGLWEVERDSRRIIPEGYAIKRRSQNFDDEGNIRQEWLISEPDKEQQLKMAMQMCEALTAEIPARPAVKHYRHGIPELANQMTFTDYHIGGYAWQAEGGSNWNLKIANDMGKAATLDMLGRAPQAETLIINQLGDWAHFDSLLNITPTSGHIIASDGSPEQMIDVCIELLDFMIVEGLRTHKNVKVIVAQGNHDLFTAMVLRRAFTRLYRDEQRVEIVNNAVPFYAIKFGRNLLGYHHGHKVKIERLPDLFNNEFRHLLGDTDRTLIHTGHQHHQEIKELGKTTVEMHRTLSSRDSHASYGGYHSERATDLITYHKQYGEVGRLSVTPAMLGM